MSSTGSDGRDKEHAGRFREKIWVLHLHDNKGSKDDHQGLGWGEIDYDAAMREVLSLGITAYWSMELAGKEATVQSRAKLQILPQ